MWLNRIATQSLYTRQYHGRQPLVHRIFCHLERGISAVHIPKRKCGTTTGISCRRCSRLQRMRGYGWRCIPAILRYRCAGIPGFSAAPIPFGARWKFQTIVSTRGFLSVSAPGGNERPGRFGRRCDRRDSSLRKNG